MIAHVMPFEYNKLDNKIIFRWRVFIGIIRIKYYIL